MTIPIREGYTTFDTTEFHRIRNAEAGGCYVKLQMLIQHYGWTLESKQKTIERLASICSTSPKKIEKALDYLVENEISIIGPKCFLVPLRFEK